MTPNEIVKKLNDAGIPAYVDFRNRDRYYIYVWVKNTRLGTEEWFRVEATMSELIKHGILRFNNEFTFSLN